MFTEILNRLGLSLEVKRKLFECRGLQRVEIFETDFGRMLVLDRRIQLIEAFEHVYHEMLVHVPMLAHPRPEKILILGGGDGGAAREVLKHRPKKITLVEIDSNVVEACRKYLRIDRGALEDERVTLRCEDASNFVKRCAENKENFDVIILDGDDPNSLSEGLFSREFYEACSKIAPYFAMQSQSPLLQRELFEKILRNTKVFAERRVYLSFVPMYPGGMWSFVLASSGEINLDANEIRRRYEERKITTRYYTPELHLAAFALPKWVKEIVERIEREG